MEREKEISTVEAFPNIITSRRYGNPFACDTKDRDQQWNTPEYECSIISDFIDGKENGSTVSDARFTSGCKFFETDTKLYTEKRTYVSIPADEDQHSNTSESVDVESELGTEAIIFDLNSTKPASTSNTDQGVETFPEPSLRLESSTGHTDGSCNNISYASQVHFSNSNNVHEQSLESQNMANLEDKSLDGLLLDS
ncbi:hypothetical protein RND71_002287 [Anisodus tanguticus]|uniref:Uncharacterized protein n=1 Tax=Anisodus tanguticus TaxID=243964 RepID=A0AAE1VYZ0_9SOLA|nr:hypothetical protein RND71_002287 [Anisodus tanguticus]